MAHVSAVNGFAPHIKGHLRGVRRALGVVAILGMALSPVATAKASAQTPSGTRTGTKAGIADTWQGTLHVGDRGLRTVLKITAGANGALTANFYSIDQDGQPLAVSKITFKDGELNYTIERLDIRYTGKMSADGKSIAGTLTMGQALPVVYERATPETAWAIPEPPKAQAPMAADANPSFEVATIKPSKPDQQGKGFRVNGGRFRTINTSLVDMISFAYDVQQKQIVDAPAWASVDKYDIDAQPDTPGAPNSAQLKSMLRKLLVDRFALKFHDDQRELSAYVLAVGKGGTEGIKMKKAEDTGNLPGLNFRGLGDMLVTNATMYDFCTVMQSAVLDRPVVDHTGLAGKWDFHLKWTPDESQFAGLGVKVPPPSDAADAPPPLFTAMQEQLGLKLEAAKTQVKTMVFDHVGKPSEN